MANHHFTENAGGELQVVGLRCDGFVNPLGVDPTPRLSWQLVAPPNNHGTHQIAYQIVVASSAKLLTVRQADLWNSEKISTDLSQDIRYRGRYLGDSAIFFWKVRVWDQNGRASAWSKAASWTTGLAHPWRARWIKGDAIQEENQKKGSTLLVRKEFQVYGKVKRAVVHVCGLGQYQLTVNGLKAGSDLLAPGWTNYRETCLYNTYDVTKDVQQGRNALGLMLGSGMYNVVDGRYTKFTGTFGPLMAIVQLEVQMADGSSITVGTDETWKTHAGPITFSSPYGGEDYDASLEPTSWKNSDFIANDWSQAITTQGPGGQLRGASFCAPPIRGFEIFKPVAIKQLSPQNFVYDFGQNASIIPKLVVSGPPGSSVKMTPAELLKPDGTVDRESVGGGDAYWKYTLAGLPKESYFPLFFYHGSRYLQVELSAQQGQPLPKVRSLTAQVVQSDSAPIGTFECDNELFNRIYTLVRWAQRSNMVSVLSDCPHRERLGWLEQTHLNGPALRYNFDLGNFFRKIENDIAEAQMPNGFVPDIAPEFVNFAGKPDDVSNPFRNSTEWGASYLLVPWQQYAFEGDLEILKTHFQGMKRYVDWLTTQRQDGILNFGLGDWYDIGPGAPGFSQLTPIPFTATAFYYDDAKVLAEMARLIGRSADAQTYRNLADSIKNSLNSKYYDLHKHQYATGSQCANSVALVMGFAPEADRSEILQNVVKDVQAKGLTAGDVGYQYLLRALADGDRSDVILKLNNQSNKPGYGYQLARGATSLTEAWDAGRSSSQNHFMLGQINEWFFHDVAGIQPDLAGPGFKKFVLKPALHCGLGQAKATYRSRYGTIVSNWKLVPQGFRFTAEVPANTTARVILPQGSQLINPASQVKANEENGMTVFTVGSGHYAFSN
jgi:hypothetical protein